MAEQRKIVDPILETNIRKIENTDLRNQLFQMIDQPDQFKRGEDHAVERFADPVDRACDIILNKIYDIESSLVKRSANAKSSERHQNNLQGIDDFQHKYRFAYRYQELEDLVTSLNRRLGEKRVKKSQGYHFDVKRTQDEEMINRITDDNTEQIDSYSVFSHMDARTEREDARRNQRSIPVGDDYIKTWRSNPNYQKIELVVPDPKNNQRMTLRDLQKQAGQLGDDSRHVKEKRQQESKQQDNRDESRGKSQAG